MSSSKGSRVEGGKKKLSSVWPTPNYSSYGKETIYLNPAQFRIHMISNHSSPLLQRALARYQLLLFPLSPFLNFSSISNDDEDGGYDGGYEDGESVNGSGNGEEEGEISYLSSLAVSLSSSSSSLHFNVSEEYQLLILSSDDDLSTLPHPLPLSHSPLLYDYYHYYDNNNNDNNDNNNGNNDINDINNDNQKRSGEEKKMKKEYRGVIIAETSFGAIRGLETFYQLIQSKEKEGGGGEGGEGEGGKEYGYYIKGGPIIMQDSPRFPWRGVMVDTSRHFIPLPDLLLCIDAISYSKMNVLHWHISDSHSFPFQSHLYPNLPITSPWSKEQVYSREDIQYLVRYARDRGVRVIPEISLPSHCLSWLPPPLSILCDDVYEDVDVSHPDPRGGRKREMINPLDEEGRRRIDVIWKEISSLFTDEYIHMGMNDINPTCWLSDPSISHHLDSLSLSPSYLLHSFLSDLTSLSQSMGRSPIIWDEGLQYDPPSNQTIIQTYPSSPIDLFSTSIERGYRTLISRRWSVEWEEDWDYYYTAEDPNLLLASSSPSLALGGELLLWSSHIFHSSLLFVPPFPLSFQSLFIIIIIIIIIITIIINIIIIITIIIRG